ncbi:MAG: hypothetical protein JWQ19_3411 [Subtercola sp.]|nr:hypothetical protein [Subtercola sp.]
MTAEPENHSGRTGRKRAAVGVGIACAAAMIIAGLATSATALPLPGAGGVVNIPLGSALTDTGVALGIAANPNTNQVYVGVDTPRAGVEIVNGSDVITDFIPVPDGASSLSFDPISGYLFATGSSRRALSMIDPATKSVSSYVLDAGPAEVAVDAIHQKVYVEGRTPDFDTVTVFDENTRTSAPSIILDTIGTGGGLVRPLSIAVDPYQQKAYALVAHPSLTYGKVTVVDGAANTIDGSAIDVDPTTRNVAIDPITHQLYSASDAGVSVIDSSTRGAIGSPLATGAGGALSVGVDTTSHRVFAGAANAQIAVIDEGAVDRVTGMVPIGGPSVAQPQQMSVNSRTGRAFSANGSSFWITALTVADPVITSGPPSHAKAGSNYSFTITATGLPAPTFSASLPSWLAIDATSGELFGVPPAAGTYPITVSASNGVGLVAEATYDLVVDSHIRPCAPWLCH